MNLPEKFASKIARPMLKLRKVSPQIMFAAGTVGVVASGVLACRATLKLDETLEKAETRVQAIHTLTEAGDEAFPEENLDRNLAAAKVKMILDVAKLYAPAVAVATISIGLLTGSHVTLTRRNAAGAAAYAALDSAYRGFQERVAEKYGEEEADKLRQGTVTIEETTTDDAGKTKKVKRQVSAGLSPYAKLFTEGNENWRPGAHNNWFFLTSQERYFNDLLQRNGYVFLNDVYKALGLPETQEGQVVGWVAGEIGRDGYISFGIDNDRSEKVRDFMAGAEDSIWLDFNVDGNIWTKAFA